VVLARQPLKVMAKKVMVKVRNVFFILAPLIISNL
jgi:hypothetical protein